MGGNSWEDSDHFVIWSTRGYQYGSPTDGIYSEDLYKIFCDYTDKAEPFFNRLRNDRDCETIEELNAMTNIERWMQRCDDVAYHEMIADILDNEFDYNWANEIIDYAIERAEAGDF